MLVKPSMWLPGARASHPLHQGLAGYWLIRLGSGDTVPDLSGRGNRATLAGGTKWIWETGPAGPWIHRTASSNNIVCPTVGQAAARGTILAAVQVNENLANEDYIISRTGAGNSRVYLYYMADGSLYSRFGGDAAVDSGFDIVRDVLYQFVVTWDNGAYAVYVDGVEVDSGAAGPPAALGTTFSVTTLDGASVIKEAYVDEVGAWNRALSASEVALLYGSRYDLGQPPSNVALWGAAAAGGAVGAGGSPFHGPFHGPLRGAA